MTRALTIPLLFVATTAFADRAVVIGRVGGWPVDRCADARARSIAKGAALGRRDSNHRGFTPEGITGVHIEGKPVTLAPLVGAKVHWSASSRMAFAQLPRATARRATLTATCSTEPKTFGKWLGYDHIDYSSSARSPSTADHLQRRSTPPTWCCLGSARIATRSMSSSSDGTHLVSPGAEAIETAGISP